MSHDGSRISPTAHYTSWVWFRNGLSHTALASSTGRALYASLWAADRAWERLGREPGLERFLLARHRTIDERLEAAIARGEVAQVLEIAAGFSPRGFRFAQRHPSLLYVEGDLPAVADAKRARLDAAGLRGAHHEVVALDAVREEGLDAALARLDPARSTAVITEGLIGYLDRATVEQLWRRLARALARFPRGVYFADLYLEEDLQRSAAKRAFRAMLSTFVRGQTHTQADDEAAAHAMLARAGFSRVALHRPTDGAGVRIVEASP
jgi:O-methyltransferase involved in polyketide biosynthesis